MGEYCASPEGDSALAAAASLALPSPSPEAAGKPRYGSCDRRCVKQVFDNLHGSISLDPLALQFVDTEEFQRLRDLKQLGLTYLVYPGAVHTRFEHSLGVYSLAGKAMNNLKTYQGEELGIDRIDMQTVKLAGLLHDIGHGPFSHLFEHEFLPRVIPGSTWSHEHMSVLLLDSIVDKHAIDIEDDYLKMVKEMIIASSKFATTKSAKDKHFLYDIVANGRNGIDVDKFDYIDRDCRACGLGSNFQYWRLMEGMRVMGDEICYPAKDCRCFIYSPHLLKFDLSYFSIILRQQNVTCHVSLGIIDLSIHKLFSTRADLHRTVYTHAKVKAVELMLVDALIEANDYLGISLHANDPEDFWKLDDTIIKSIETAPNNELKKAKEIIQRIRRRELYKFCNQYSVPKDKLEHFKNITAQDIVCSQKSSEVLLKEEDVAVSNVKIDLTRGKDNPLESIKFFKDFGCNEKFPITDDRVSHLLPAYNEDRIVRVYAKKPELVEAVSEAFENLQLRMYGEKTQVHDTPKKKRLRSN
ncbi:Deoxynucleoside triphosphate triphosphohydrolase SAMHD1-like protein [Dichanthelium oligosanthes]|uniref:Deoxynucleoside triphosphate triphosphohydrolase SAMHD1-like protein n=1 Tax=Dichanthelium oligosanthes TaxID=888268 RepID=A0A1E5WHF2_9POAL|nr:Deoxynucleoside triphosphate triphosphohydrolase SAMHD1-like protein [Dichanthelium oligosanthes]